MGDSRSRSGRGILRLSIESWPSRGGAGPCVKTGALQGSGAVQCDMRSANHSRANQPIAKSLDDDGPVHAQAASFRTTTTTTTTTTTSPSRPRGTSPLNPNPSHDDTHTPTIKRPIATAAMFLQRSAVAAARRAAVAPVLRRSFATTMIRRESARHI